MVGINFPTNKDVHIEVEGKILAAVNGYKIKSKCDKRYIRSFWNNDPIGILAGDVIHEIELSRIYLYSNGINNYQDYFELSDFNLVLVKPGKRVVYKNCKWTQISESINEQRMLIEEAMLISKKRHVFAI